MSKENPIEEKTECLRKYLKCDIRHNNLFFPRPFFVEITGTPDSGKSTIIEKLYDDLRKENLKIWRPQEGAQVIQLIERTTPLYNIRTGYYALQMLIDLSHGHQYDIVIFERCCFDMFVWMDDWFALEKLSQSEKHSWQEVALSRFYINDIDAAYFVVCEPEESMKRALKNSTTKKVGATTNPAKVAELVEKYRSAFKTLSPKYKQLELIDTTNMKEKEMVNIFTVKVLDALTKKSKNG